MLASRSRPLARSLAVQVLIALVIGLAAGIAISASGNPSLLELVSTIEPIGTLWINAIRMTVLPLVISAIVVGIASAPDIRTVGSLGGRAVLLFGVLLFAAALFSTFVAHPILSYLTVDPDGAAALRASAAQASASAVEGAQKIQSARQWLLDLVPVNPIKAAADGAMLPLIVYAVAFSIALMRVAAPERATLLNVARAVMDASLQLVRWILLAAPVGVFVLSVVIATRLGAAAAGAVVSYIALVSGICVLVMALLYLVVWLTARRRAGAFPRFWAPAQAVAFSSRSSLATLPAMIETAEAMGQPAVIRSFLLPLAVATFRVGSAINIPVGALFLARLYDVDVTTPQMLTVAVTAVVTSFSVPSIPSGTIIVMVPVLLAANLPVAGIGILMGVDTLPDMFRTTTNVTADLATATILSGDQPAGQHEAASPAIEGP